MKKEDFDLLTESLEQAVEYKRGNKRAARGIVRSIDIPEYNARDIVTVRHKLDLTQKGLANVIGVSPRTVEAWEAGVNKPNGSAQRILYLLDNNEHVSALLKA